ncbi:MAG: YkgJ family cysteine cluster protein [Lentisphaeria bacterium]|nr:YkgJ family cysteine cluster protein [Lentisphaeria bacterium]
MKKFVCSRCGACCRWPGAVKLTDAEVDVIAGFLNIPLADFLENHTVITPDRKHLSLCEKENGECEYLAVDSDGLSLCLIEKVKPQQCRNFPGKWNFPGWQEKCAGEYK